MATGRSSDFEGLHEEYFEFLCSVCKKKNRNSEADKFCHDCQDYYCVNCVKFHYEVPALNTHDIIDRAQFRLATSLRFPTVPTERCHEHNNKPVDMFCLRHDTVGCTNCMVSYHSVCDNVYIPDYVKTNFKSGKTVDVDRKLKRLANSLHDIEKAFLKEKTELTDRREKLVLEIRTLRDMINKRLDELEQNMLKELDDQLKTMLIKMEDGIKYLQETIRRVEHTHDSLKSAGGNISQQFVSKKRAVEIVRNAESMITNARCKLTPVDIDFKADQRILSLLNEMQNLGILCDKMGQSTTRMSDLPRPSKVQSKFQSSCDYESTGGFSSSLLNIKGCKKYSVSTKSDDFTCDICSVCVLEDGTIVIADGMNDTLKCLDSSSFKVKGSCELSVSPSQVCAIKKREVAVASGLQGIQFVSLAKSKMHETINISTGFWCFGLACSYGRLYVSDGESIIVYNLSGDMQRQFAIDQFGQALFSTINSLAISGDNTRIYVADEEFGLIVLDINGQLLGQFNPPILSGAFSVCLHKNGDVLVSGYNSNNVLQFSADGKIYGEILKTESDCQAICLDQKNKKLIVCYEDNNELEIFSTKSIKSR